MELKEVYAIPGHPGLYKYVAPGRNGLIVESLVTGARFNTSIDNRVLTLGDITVYSDEGDMPLARVFEKIYASTGGKPAIDPKSTPEELKKWFASVLPGYDRDQVHVSDMKKIASWYNILVGLGLKEFRTAEESDELTSKKSE